MPDLHTALEAAITSRLEVARAATERGANWTATGAIVEHDGDASWHPVVYDEGYPTEAEAAHIALHDPADAVRRYERDLKVIKRHSPASDEPDFCAWCYSAEDISHYLPHPCPELADLLDVYPEAVPDA